MADALQHAGWQAVVGEEKDFSAQFEFRSALVSAQQHHLTLVVKIKFVNLQACKVVLFSVTKSDINFI